MNTTPAPRIAIIGAGPGGLTCARILQRRGIDVTVHDRDAQRDARNQGGTLDMHPDSGQVALETAGLKEQFDRIARPEGEQMRLLGHDGTVLFDNADQLAAGQRGPFGPSPEIDRGQLRDLLIDSLEPGTIRWGHRFHHAERLGDGVHRLHFHDDATAEVDLLIGADGAWSKVRPLVSAALPAYTGVTFVEVGLDDVDTRHPTLAALTGHGTTMALHDNKGLIAQRNSHQHIRVYVGMRTDEHWYDKAGIELADTAAVRDVLLKQFAGWSDELFGFITDTDTGYINRPLYAMPVPHTWEHTPGVTILGDAAHLMSPFSGMGANLAMLDGCHLAEAIVGEPGIDEAVHAYESAMLPRSAEAAAGAEEGINSAFAPDSTEQARVHLTATH
ncbi:FAD-dependent oxidoreductase [Streptomyces sp. NPDC055299]